MNRLVLGVKNLLNNLVMRGFGVSLAGSPGNVYVGNANFFSQVSSYPDIINPEEWGVQGGLQNTKLANSFDMPLIFIVIYLSAVFLLVTYSHPKNKPILCHVDEIAHINLSSMEDTLCHLRLEDQ